MAEQGHAMSPDTHVIDGITRGCEPSFCMYCICIVIYVILANSLSFILTVVE